MKIWARTTRGMAILGRKSLIGCALMACYFSVAIADETSSQAEAIDQEPVSDQTTTTTDTDDWTATITREQRVNDKVVGGNYAERGEFPFIAAFRVNRNGAMEYYCGGTAISKEWILTAAHCFKAKGLSSRYDTAKSRWVIEGAGPVEVVLGAVDLKEDDTAAYPVADVILHKEYVATDGNKGAVNDIALVKIKGQWPGEVARLSYSSRSDIDSSEGRVYVAGFGTTQQGASTEPYTSNRTGAAFRAGSNRLLRAMLPATLPEVCAGKYVTFNGQKSICVGYEQGQHDACHGDSGGPIVALSEPDATGRQRVYQMGLVSYGKGCAKPSRYGVYTRVSAYRQWVTGHVPTAKFEDVNPESDKLVTLEVYEAISNLLQSDQDLIDVRLLKSVGGEKKEKTKFSVGNVVIFEITPKVTGKLGVWDVNARGEVTQIFPNAHMGTGASLTVTAGKTVYVPDESYGFDFTARPPSGESKLIAIIIPEEVNLPEKVAATIDKGFTAQKKPKVTAMNFLNEVATLTDRGFAPEARPTAAYQSDLPENWASATKTYHIRN